MKQGINNAQVGPVKRLDFRIRHGQERSRVVRVPPPSVCIDQRTESKTLRFEYFVSGSCVSARVRVRARRCQCGYGVAVVAVEVVVLAAGGASVHMREVGGCYIKTCGDDL